MVSIVTCSCNIEYVGEASRNFQSCIDEHLDTSKLSEPARHLYSHPEHFFTWKSIVSIQSWTLRRIDEPLLLAKLRPYSEQTSKSFRSVSVPHGYDMII